MVTNERAEYKRTRQEEWERKRESERGRRGKEVRKSECVRV
jgi:hypothetical protein